MTPTEFRASLASLGYSQRGFAAHIEMDERTVRRWALGELPVPRPVVLLLECMGALTVP
jgi:DNA-binding transcriptional regulator YiaG